MINDILRKHGIHITKTVTTYGNFYAIRSNDNEKQLTDSFSDQNEAIIAALLIVIAKICDENNELLKKHAIPD